jgi:hypothetical protein
MSEAKVRNGGMETTNMREFCIIMVFEPANQLVLGGELSPECSNFLLEGPFAGVETM